VEIQDHDRARRKQQQFSGRDGSEATSFLARSGCSNGYEIAAVKIKLETPICQRIFAVLNSSGFEVTANGSRIAVAG